MKKGISFGNGVGIVCEIGVVCCFTREIVSSMGKT